MAKDIKKGRTRQDMMASLPAADRAYVETRTAELHTEIEGLKALRHLAKRSQEQIAQGLGVKQPAVLKIERQTDLYLSTLRRFVEAAAGRWNCGSSFPAAGSCG